MGVGGSEKGMIQGEKKWNNKGRGKKRVVERIQEKDQEKGADELELGSEGEKKRQINSSVQDKKGHKENEMSNKSKNI